MHNLLDATQLVGNFGYLGIFLLVFLESGVFFGFFLPGDSLLFTAGLLAAQGDLNITALVVLAVTAAILGNNVGYWTGQRLSHSIFNRKNSFFFSHKRVTQAHNFFAKYGDQSLVLARFIPAVRTFVPIIAGVGEMRYKSFLTFNTIGGILWGTLLPLLGYYLGKTVPNIELYIIPVLLVIIALSVLPIMWSHYKHRRAARVRKLTEPSSGLDYSGEAGEERGMARKYGPKAQKAVEKEVHEHKHKGKFKSREQAVAVGLSKARKQGAKVPKKKS